MKLDKKKIKNKMKVTGGEKINRIEFDIVVPSEQERYEGKNTISTILVVDYVNFTYTITPPVMVDVPNCKLPLLIAKSIELAYKKAQTELARVPNE